MKLPDSFPVTLRKGGSVVKIYRHTNAGYDEFKVAYYAAGKRKFETFADYARARKRADEITGSIVDGNIETLTLSREECVLYRRALEALKSTSTSIDTAATLFAQATAKLRDVPLLDAVQFYLKRHPHTFPKKTVREVAHELIALKAKDVSAIYIKDLKFRLGRFADAFQCNIADVAAPELNVFLRSLDGSKRGRANFKGAIRTMFRFAVSSKYLPKDHIDWADVDAIKVTTSKIEIFTPAEMAKLLAAAEMDPSDLPNGFNKRYATTQGLLPLLVLGGFAGLRTAEIHRQCWSDINLERGWIRVTDVKGNTAQNRLVPISANLRQWLEKCRRTDGLCCDYPRPEEAIRRLARRARIEWKHNALRHSFISYRVAETQNVNQVALEAGNSVHVIFRHYRELVTPEEARTWFSIIPNQPANIVPENTSQSQPQPSRKVGSR